MAKLNEQFILVPDAIRNDKQVSKATKIVLNKYITMAQYKYEGEKPYGLSPIFTLPDSTMQELTNLSQSSITRAKQWLINNGILVIASHHKYNETKGFSRATSYQLDFDALKKYKPSTYSLIAKVKRQKGNCSNDEYDDQGTQLDRIEAKLDRLTAILLKISGLEGYCSNDEYDLLNINDPLSYRVSSLKSVSRNESDTIEGNIEESAAGKTKEEKEKVITLEGNGDRGDDIQDCLIKEQSQSSLDGQISIASTDVSAHTCVCGSPELTGTQRSLEDQIETKKINSSFSSSVDPQGDQIPNVSNQEPSVHAYTMDDFSELQADVVSYGIRLNGMSTDEQQEIKREFCEWLNGLTFSLEAAESCMREKLLKLFEGYLSRYDEPDQTTEIPDEWETSLQPVAQEIDKKYIDTVSDWTKAYIEKFRTSSTLEKHLEEARKKINDSAANEKTRQMALNVFNLAVGEKIRALKFKEFNETRQIQAV